MIPTPVRIAQVYVGAKLALFVMQVVCQPQGLQRQLPCFDGIFNAQSESQLIEMVYPCRVCLGICCQQLLHFIPEYGQLF
ncbi:hypothetical protein A8B98_10420 [Hymenobacter sp. UV11]|nr:hypothetical protein A8B98_10420 [Hymenobacter sp. UV11]